MAEINQVAVDARFLVNDWGIAPSVVNQLIGHDITKNTKPSDNTTRRIISLTKVKTALDCLFSIKLQGYEGAIKVQPNANLWVSKNNTMHPFHGQKPIDYMVDRGYQGIEDTRKFLMSWLVN